MVFCMRSEWLVLFYTSIIVMLICSSSVQGFQPSTRFSVHRYPVTSTPSRSFILSLSADETLATKSTSNEYQPEEPKKAAVKCPDCDLCDGSGRSVDGIKNCVSAFRFLCGQSYENLPPKMIRLNVCLSLLECGFVFCCSSESAEGSVRYWIGGQSRHIGRARIS